MNIANPDNLYTNENIDAVEKNLEFEKQVSKMSAHDEYRMRNKLDMSINSKWNSSSSSF